MISGVADTHALIWYVFDDPRLSQVASDFIDDALAKANPIIVSSMTLVEVVYLVEKRRVDPETLDKILEILGGEASFTEWPVDRHVVQAMKSIHRKEVPDLPDRVIAATAVSLGVPLISRDGRIRASSVTTIW